MRLPKSWVKDQENSGKWTHTVLDGPGLHRFLLEGNKEYLKIGEADSISRGDRYDPCDENDIVSDLWNCYFQFRSQFELEDRKNNQM